MKILLVGSGGREHALALGLRADKSCTELHAAPGNPGIASLATLHPVAITDNSAILTLAQQLAVDLVVVGPEVPLVNGVADVLREAGFAVFGPSKAAAQLEGSKDFAKQVMRDAGVPTAKSFTCNNQKEIEKALDTFGAPYVVKHDGLAAGKGVVVTEDRDLAIEHALQSPQVVIEEFLDGPEVSLFGISDGIKVIAMQPAQDFKRAFDGDLGPNTGGMGAYSPLPWAPDEIMEETLDKVLNPTIQFGDEIKYILKTDNGLWIKKDTITKTYGAITLHVLDDASSNINWTGTWGTTTSTFVSPSKSFYDGSTGDYSNNANKTYTYVPTINLSTATSAMVSFYAKWEIEADYDFVQFQVSTDNGATWIGQCGNYTVLGTSANGSVQPENQPIYEGNQPNWVFEEINLSDYLGQQIKFRFQFQSDGGSVADGFYFDDFKIFYKLDNQIGVPLASFSTTGNSFCQNSPITFTDFSTNSPSSWSWNFGDGGTSTQQNPQHTYSNPGNYTVNLTVTNATGFNSTSETITIESCVSTTDLLANGVSIRPNPNNGNFVITGLDENTQFTIFDFNGKKVLQRTVNMSSEKIELAFVRSGLYYLEASKNGQIGRMKFAVIN